MRERETKQNETDGQINVGESSEEEAKILAGFSLGSESNFLHNSVFFLKVFTICLYYII